MALIALMTLEVPMVLMVMMALVDPMALVRGPTCQGLLGLVLTVAQCSWTRAWFPNAGKL